MTWITLKEACLKRKHSVKCSPQRNENSIRFSFALTGASEKPSTDEV